VVPKLPGKLSPLWDLAYNFWFAWSSPVRELFTLIDPQLWRQCEGNPVTFLNRLPQHVMEELARDEFFLERMQDVHKSLVTYLSKTTSAVPFPGTESKQAVVAYFSLEFGVDKSLPIYSGGLGILAGDHLKSASDLNIPLLGIGLCYREGYFRQYLTPDGWQQENYPESDFEQMPMKPCLDTGNKPVHISVDLAGRECFAQIWQVDVGRIKLYLLDTNIKENDEDLRWTSARLYGGDLEMRVRQEILLGIGGVRLLEALGLDPKVIHMNEGHSAFAGLERIRVFMDEYGLPLEAAMELVASSSVFTTHTPVPAGNDRFSPELIEKYFSNYARSLNLAMKSFMALGREDMRDDSESFCMTVLALKLSRFNNGVSELHGHVSRNMWKKVWPQYPVEDVPIGAITNGVHMPTWVAPDLASLYDRYLGGNWREDPDCQRIWRQADSISESELWRTHERLRERLVEFVRRRLKETLIGRGARRKDLQAAEEVLDPGALTICFARRFATYKRATMLLQDKERLLRIMHNEKRPVQFIFAGKAHPQDQDGKKFIQEIVQVCREEPLRYKMVFLEDYDMEVAKYMLQGGDIWLNNPRVPLEACGTSGMKAMANGVINLSTLDGWWAEAYKSDNSVGYSIGRGETYDDLGYQDFVESQIFYNYLENDILPDFYDRGRDNMPRNWIRRMKNALVHLGPVFNAHRMVEDYAGKAYLPAYENYQTLMKNNYAPAKELAAWRMEIMTRWNQIKIRNVGTETPERLYVGEPFIVHGEIFLDGMSPKDVQAEIYAGPLNQQGDFTSRQISVMEAEGITDDGWHVFRGETDPREAGRFGFTVRIVPRHPLLLDPHSLGLISWAE
jgi:starch phosphorylase